MGQKGSCIRVAAVTSVTHGVSPQDMLLTNLSEKAVYRITKEVVDEHVDERTVTGPTRDASNTAATERAARASREPLR